MVATTPVPPIYANTISIEVTTTLVYVYSNFCLHRYCVSWRVPSLTSLQPQEPSMFTFFSLAYYFIMLLTLSENTKLAFDLDLAIYINCLFYYWKSDNINSEISWTDTTIQRKNNLFLYSLIPLITKLAGYKLEKRHESLKILSWGLGRQLGGISTCLANARSWDWSLLQHTVPGLESQVRHNSHETRHGAHTYNHSTGEAETPPEFEFKMNSKCIARPCL